MIWQHKVSGVLVLLGLTVAVHAEWFTVSGIAGQGDSNYVQVDPAAIEVDGDIRQVLVRVSRASEFVSADGVVHRSFDARVRIDCATRSARYLRATFYAQPHFMPPALVEKTFAEGDLRPMAFQGIAGRPAQRVIRAACSVRGGAARLPSSGVLPARLRARSPVAVRTLAPGAVPATAGSATPAAPVAFALDSGVQAAPRENDDSLSLQPPASGVEDATGALSA